MSMRRAIPHQAHPLSSSVSGFSIDVRGCRFARDEILHLQRVGDERWSSSGPVLCSLSFFFKSGAAGSSEESQKSRKEL